MLPTAIAPRRQVRTDYGMDTEWLHPALTAQLEEGFAYIDAGIDVPLSVLAMVDRTLITSWLTAAPDSTDRGHVSDVEDRWSEEPTLSGSPLHFPWSNALTCDAAEKAMAFLDSGLDVPLFRLWMLDVSLIMNLQDEEDRLDFVPVDWV